jgi:uncharacterized membrane protein
MTLRRLSKKVSTSLWFIPVLCVLAGSVLSFVTISIDRSTSFGLIPQSFTGGAEAALAILETVAASMVSLTALVLTVTMVVVQLAMGQFSPRIVQTFLRDKPSQLTIGVFVATFAHAMLALREVNVVEDQVPGLAVVFAYGLIVISIILLVVYVHHIGESLRVSALIELVSEQTRRTIDAQFDRPVEVGGHADDANDPLTIVAPHSGVVSSVDEKRLVTIAEGADCVLRLIPAPGEFVPAGAPLLRVTDGRAQELDHAKAARTVSLTLDRAVQDDIAYGFRLLVDIAERSLADSPYLDPTTAVQAIDRLHDCLRQLATRPFPSGQCRDEQGRVRLVVSVPSWDDYVRLSFEEIRLAGAGSPQVTRRLEAALLDLSRIAPPERQRALREQHDHLVESVRRALSDPDDIRLALTADAQGLG